MKILRYPLVALVLAVLLCDLAASSKNVIFSQVAHRHGARTPLVSVNLTRICGPDNFCGQLNHDGEVMLRQVGTWARNRYMLSLDPTVSYLADFATRPYSSEYFNSRSTDLPRTLQSADAFLRGLFPNLTSFFPVVHTVSFWSDELLLVDALPAFHLPDVIDSQTNLNVLTPFVLEKIDNETLSQVGMELHLDSVCSGPTYNIAGCALEVQDVMASYASQTIDNGTSRLSLYPLSNGLLPMFQYFRWKWNTPLFSYNASRPTDRQRGSLGQNLANEIVASMIDKIFGNQSKPFVFKEWSAHDSTVMPLCATLGQNGMMLPLFGQSYFIELLNDTASSVPPTDLSRYSVRILYGAPDQGPGDHAFEADPFPLSCTNSSGVTYSTMEDCPLEDFRRYILGSKAKSDAGYCYLDDRILESINCEASNSTAKDPNSLCVFYRSRCQDYACGENYMNTTDWSCRPVSQPHIGVSVSAAAVMTSVAAVAGALIGAILSKLILGRKLKALYSSIPQ